MTERVVSKGASSPIDLDFSAGGYLYATHPLHAFAARCPPPLADWAIKRYTRSGDSVLDPMAGSGTTLVEACLLGRQARGVEIDPLARLIAFAKATPVDLETFDHAVSATQMSFSRRKDDGWRPALRDLDKWFRSEVSSDLARLRAAILHVDVDATARNLLWTIFSALIVGRTSVANARDLVHSRHHYRAWTSDPDVGRRFFARAAQARKMMHDYSERLRGTRGEVNVEVLGGDARALPYGSRCIDLVFTSPPYCSAIDYTRAHIFAVGWMTDALGVTIDEYRTLGRKYVGSERAPLSEVNGAPLPPALGHDGVDELVQGFQHDAKRAWIVHKYFRDMEAVLQECRRVVKPGGRIVLVVCPSNIRKIPIPTHEVFADIAENLPGGALRVEELHRRTIHDHRRVMPYLEASFGKRMRTEYVLVLQVAAGTKGAKATRSSARERSRPGQSGKLNGQRAR